jgi:N-methylhydantoinase A
MTTHPTYKIGIDIGGTHTDVFVASEDSRSESLKVPTTHDRYSEGVVDGLREAAARYDCSLETFLERTRLVGHGATITTNALLEGTEATTGLLTSEGLRDVLELNRGREASPYDLQKEPSTALVPRHLRRDVTERVTRGGEVHRRLDESDLEAQVDALVEEGAEAVAAAFMFSFENDAHEERVRRYLDGRSDVEAASVSSDVHPDVGIYDRSTATAVDASLKPILREYLNELTARLREHGYDGPFYIMQGNGGVSSAESIESHPITSVNSGPAAVGAACAYYGDLTGHSDVISFDMGGTSTDVCLVRDGTPLMTTENEVGDTPVPIPMVDINTVGAGGGSIVWRDDNDILRVGPRSAGSDPGPMCYDGGGDEPTLTDANLLLGFLNPEFFRGGENTLDLDRARAGIDRQHARPLDLTPEAVAAGAYEIATDHLTSQIRQISVERGYDPRNFSLVAAGGAGAVHAGPVAEEFGTTVVVPNSAGTFSAAGVLLSEVKHTFVESIDAELDEDVLPTLQDAFADMERQATDALEADGVASADATFRYELETRYWKQAHDVTIPAAPDPEDPETLADRHHEEHEAVYSFRDEDTSIRVRSARLVATVTTDGDLHLDRRADTESESRVKDHRDVYFPDANERVRTPIYDGTEPLGTDVAGPAIVEEPTTTIVVTPGCSVETDAYGNYYVRP